MKRFSLAIAVALGMTLVCAENVSASAPKSPPCPNMPNGQKQGLRPLPQTPPVNPRRVVPPATPGPTVLPSFGGGGILTQGAWVGYNRSTGRYSVAFDSPGVSGTGILLRAGFDIIVLGPTTWTDAVSYLKSIGAPGW